MKRSTIKAAALPAKSSISTIKNGRRVSVFGVAIAENRSFTADIRLIATNLTPYVPQGIFDPCGD